MGYTMWVVIILIIPIISRAIWSRPTCNHCGKKNSVEIMETLRVYHTSKNEVDKSDRMNRYKYILRKMYEVVQQTWFWTTV